MGFQTERTKRPNRREHIWKRQGRKRWKCLLCGAVVCDRLPPDTPTPKDFHPDSYEELTDHERELVAYQTKPLPKSFPSP